VTYSIEFGRKEGETDEEWSAACKDMARALAEARGMEHLLPESHAPEKDE
jgi:hypothetical protein